MLFKRSRVDTYTGFRTKWAAPVPGVGRIDFKNLVSAFLINSGYRRCVVSAPAYQGYADVIGYDENGTCWAYRCVEQATPVGVEAIQEALAGKREAQAARVGVVAITTYTKDAQRLAARERVRLVMLK